MVLYYFGPATETKNSDTLSRIVNIYNESTLKAENEREIERSETNIKHFKRNWQILKKLSVVKKIEKCHQLKID